MDKGFLTDSWVGSVRLQNAENLDIWVHAIMDPVVIYHAPGGSLTGTATEVDVDISPPAAAEIQQSPSGSQIAELSGTFNGTDVVFSLSDVGDAESGMCYKGNVSPCGLHITGSCGYEYRVTDEQGDLGNQKPSTAHYRVIGHFHLTRRRADTPAATVGQGLECTV